MITRFINHIGYKTIGFTLSFYEVLLFVSITILNLFNPIHYNSRIYRRFIYQINQTSIKIIPKFILMASFFGSILIGLMIVIATDFNLQMQIGTLIVSFAINEFAALFTAFFIAYRFSPMIYKSVSTLSLESDTQKLNNLIIPRILSTLVSSVSLSIVFSLIMIFSAYLFVFFIIGMDLHTYKYLVFSSLEIYNLFILFFKSVLFAFIVTIAPLYKGLRSVRTKYNSSKLFVLLFFTELLSIFILKAADAI